MQGRPSNQDGVDWSGLIALTKEMLSVASAGRWDELRALHRERDRRLSEALRSGQQPRFPEESLRALAELNDALTLLVERERREVGGRLAQIRRDTNACSAYRDSAPMASPHGG